MSWPQNPNDPQQPRPQQPPQPAPAPAPAPGWPPAGQQPQQPYAASQYPPSPQPPAGPGPYGYGQAPGPYGPGQGYGQPYGHPGNSPQPPPAPAPPRRGRRTALAVAGGVVALAVVGVAITLAMRGGKGGHAEAGGVHRIRASTAAQAGPPPSQGPDSTAGPAKPMYPGWQTQTQQEHGFRYDVPPASEHWTLAPPDIRAAYTDDNGQPIVVMSGTADYREGGCASPGQSNAITQAGKGQLAAIGTQGSSGGTLQTNARNVAGNWGFAAYGGPDHRPRITVSQAVPWNHNGISGYTATATITGIYRPSPCVPARATARGIAQRLPDGTVSEWVIYADQGVPNALTSAEMDKIMSTVRPYEGG